MPPNTSFCDICGGHDHLPNMYHLLQNVSYIEHDPSCENDFYVEYANALNERSRYDGPQNPNFNKQQGPRGPSINAYQGPTYQGGGGGFDHQNRGNYRGQGYQSQAPYGQSYGYGHQPQYNQGSYGSNHQGGGSYNYGYGNKKGTSSGGYQKNPGNQYGNSQYPPPGSNGPRLHGTQLPLNSSLINAPSSLSSPKSNLEALMESFVGAQAKKIVEFEDGFKQSNIHLKMVETQLAQLASSINQNQTYPNLPPQGHDSKKQMNAIVTRSGRGMNDGGTSSDVPKSNVGDKRVVGDLDEDDVEHVVSPKEVETDDLRPMVATPLQPLVPKLPFPQIFARQRMDAHFAKFLEMISKLHVTIPFTDAIKKMPTYSRFLKEILSGKRDCDVKETVNLTENCSAIILNQMPPKLKDPGSFSIFCVIKKLEISNSLCDLGASVSLMPYSVFTKLEVGDLVPTNITLQLSDYSVKYPIGKIEDVPLRVGKFVIPVDIVVLDMDEDVHVPIILGRPFLATAGAIIDVKQRKITLKVGEGSLVFDLNKAMNYPSSTNEKCFLVDSFDPPVHDMQEHLLATNDPLELAILNREGLGDVGVEAANYKELLDSTPLYDQSEQ
ncbi:uncharacterized protein [Spinacia oleracea]|uniref:Aspartic peptidase DDI1-type domain-containing protein n=1 Tax=Spinacia oleracea TaxID=3562 RepID=A0A9R0JJR6_SPIOL|nr:uncharacterized protein LOC110776633 [Spinacia oleracea]